MSQDLALASTSNTGPSSGVIKSSYDTENEKILQYYRNYIYGDDQKFEMYNSVSVSNILIPMTGMYGKEPQELALTLMKKYIIWYKENKEDSYFPDYGTQQMFPISSLIGAISIVEEYDLEPLEKLKKINKLINESQKHAKKINYNEYMRRKRSKNDKILNVMAIGSGAFLGWALTKLFFK